MQYIYKTEKSTTTHKMINVNNIFDFDFEAAEADFGLRGSSIVKN